MKLYQNINITMGTKVMAQDGTKESHLANVKLSTKGFNLLRRGVNCC